MNDLDNHWAWSQVEAMADRSLDAASARRMRAAMAKDAELREAVERAGALRHELARLRHVPVPSGQRRRLLNIARGARASRGPALRRAAPIAFAMAVAAAAAAIGLSALLQRPSPPAPTPQAQALADFETAMAYLQRSAAIAGDEVTTAVGGGLRDALAVSRDAVSRDAAQQKKQQPKNGG